MDTFTVILATTLPFLIVAFVLYRALFARVTELALRPPLAILLYWLAIALVPWCLLWLEVPLANSIFRSFPSLQTGAWDIGLAINLSLGMLLSYLIGVVAAILASRRFLLGAKHGS